MTELKIENWRGWYELYFKEFNRLAVGEYADLSYGNDKPNDTASSLESIIAYSNYISVIGGNMEILNAGSGASSWVFRKIFEQWGVTCVDPHSKYNKFVQALCIENDLNYAGFYNGISIIKNNSISHVYYDYGAIERLPYLGYAIDIAKKSVYVDDVDSREVCKPYRDHVIALCNAKGLKWFDCKESLDEHGRSGIIIEK